jgi:chromatin remodeling complex protein RSC6
MSVVHITADETQLALLIAFCNQHKMGCEVETAASRTLSISPDFCTPCPALKAFCGQEMMTSRGKMKPIDALDFILAYAKRNNLIEKLSISLDPQLQDVFATKELSISQSELPKRLNALFSA